MTFKSNTFSFMSICPDISVNIMCGVVFVYWVLCAKFAAFFGPLLYLSWSQGGQNFGL